MPITSENIKLLTAELGADLTGIAAANSFESAPQGFRPCDILPQCASVIILACQFPSESLDAHPDTYTSVRNQISEKMNIMAKTLSEKLTAIGAVSYPVSSISASSHNGRYMGPISLKHAAVLAGLGKIGKNTLLINNKLGNMLWLSAVLTSTRLPADRVAEYETCPPDCNLCIASCPVNALGEPSMKQTACLAHAFKQKEGELNIQCWACRKICPNHAGIN